MMGFCMCRCINRSHFRQYLISKFKKNFIFPIFSTTQRSKIYMNKSIIPERPSKINLCDLKAFQKSNAFHSFPNATGHHTLHAIPFSFECGKSGELAFPLALLLNCTKPLLLSISKIVSKSDSVESTKQIFKWQYKFMPLNTNVILPLPANSIDAHVPHFRTSKAIAENQSVDWKIWKTHSVANFVKLKAISSVCIRPSSNTIRSGKHIDLQFFWKLMALYIGSRAYWGRRRAPRRENFNFCKEQRLHADAEHAINTNTFNTLQTIYRIKRATTFQACIY